MKTVFISDTHLGTRFCQHEKLYHFLCQLENDIDLQTIFLVGDIIDITQLDMKRLVTKHHRVIKKLFQLAKRKTVIYIPGNHDIYFRREFNQRYINQIYITEEYTFISSQGQSFRVLHGDKYDKVIHSHPILYHLGDLGYHILYHVSWIISYLRNQLGYTTDFSLAFHIKKYFKQSLQYIMNFEHSVIQDAIHHQTDGVICGHIHKAEIKDIHYHQQSFRYINCGCWTESGYETLIVENDQGELILKNYHEYINNE